MPEVFTEDVHGLPIVPVLYHVDLQDKQRADPGLREIIYQLETGEKVPPTAREEIPELPFLLRIEQAGTPQWYSVQEEA